jgi:hypothetical protein
MALYSEPSSMTGSTGRMCVDRAPKLSGRASVDSHNHQTDYSAARTGPPRAGDALRAGTCRRCGCVGLHATADVCIEALREALAEVWGGEVRRTGRPSKGRKSAER